MRKMRDGNEENKKRRNSGKVSIYMKESSSEMKLKNGNYFV